MVKFYNLLDIKNINRLLFIIIFINILIISIICYINQNIYILFKKIKISKDIFKMISYQKI